MAAVDLRHILLDLLPSFDMKERCRELGIQHHLEKIIPDLWAINAVIRDATMRAWTQPDVEMWMADAGAAIADVQNLLDRILEWPGRAAAPSNPLLRSFRVAFRLSILQELKEMGLRLKELVLRGSALDLRKEMMDAMDPCDEEYSYVLGEEVVGRDEARDNIVEILQQNQSSSNSEPFVIVIHDERSLPSYPSMGKTTLARMIYHHPWVRQHFHHRIWVDVSFDLSWDQLSIGREFARSITGDSCDHLQSHQAIWLLVNERLGQRRYLLILNEVYYDYTEEGLKDKWDQLKHNLLHVGGIGSTVVIITTKYTTEYTSWSIDIASYRNIFGCKEYMLAGLSEDAWIKLVMRDTFIGSAQDKENTCTINLLLQFAEQQYKTIKGSPLLAKTLGSIFRYAEKLSKSIHKLEKLLILKLAYCQKLQMLPDSITALTNLQELDVEGCQSFMKLPEGLVSMKKLTMLNVDKCVSLTQLPHGIEQLTNLQKLTMHTTTNSLSSVILELQSLVNLKELRLKTLNGLSSAEDARALKLEDKILLECSTLSWEWWDIEVALVTNIVLLDEQVLEHLQPNLALKNLEILSYMGKKLPSWMACKKENLWHLTEIKLVNLKKCERLPPLGQLPKLETVEISGMDSISAVDDAFYGDGNGDTFPRLESLIFSEMPMLERWLKAKGEGDMFPMLLRLILIQCPKFKEFHVRPSSRLLALSLWLNNDKLLTSEFVGWQNLKYVTALEITGCEELRCLPQGIKYLEDLSHLYIIRCNNLISLPDWLAELKSLKHLIVRDCAMLSFIPERLKQSPRFHIWNEGCPKLQL
ncbi:putative disease resistance protein RGA4 [Musa acuminata AAA Group]|uniref:putative disease resistance protein RGA4 n=1 Tax=Musa acuminata AAA Group TaxID=214697 RepID=UPI0031E49789